MNQARVRLVRPCLVASAVVATVATVATIATDAAVAPARAQDAPGPRPKVIVLGFDGLAADRTEALIDAGKMPALAKLRAAGGYSRLRTSNPAQSPVSWASITTGLNPGKTGIYDFVRRVPVDAAGKPLPPTNLGDAAPGAHEGRLEPARLDIGLAARLSVEPLSWWQRTGLLAVAGLLGAVTAGAISYAAGARWPKLRKGTPFEGSLTGGAALFACAAFAVVRWVPDTVPTAVNLRSGEPFWVTLDKAGVRTVALEAPLAFPADEMHAGCCLAGLGVPDMTGTWGSFSVWSDDVSLPSFTEMAGSGFYVDPKAESFDVLVGGPPDPTLREDAKAAIRMACRMEAERRGMSTEWTRADRRASEAREASLRLGLGLVAKLRVQVARGTGATVALQDGASVALAPGVWSDLVPVVFEANPVVKLRGRVRLLLDDAGAPAPGPQRPPKPFRLFVGQVQWDLDAVPPNVALTSPRSLAPELAKAIGPAETIGWPEMTNPVKERMLSDQAFVDHTYLLLGLREKRLYDRLRRDDWDCLFAMFSEPDRVQHALYRHVDPKCPTHDPEAAKRFGGEIDRIYAEADRIVAQTIALAPKDAVVLVVSDHGFAPFRRGVNLNNLFRAKGWQAARSGVAAAEDISKLGSAGFFGAIDWSRTKAYSTGLGNVYLNVAGRETNGSVPLDQYDAVLDAVAKDIESLREADGTKVVRRVYRGKDIYRGPRMREAPDLVVGFEWGYRVSWQTALGGTDDDIITPNTNLWSGDHCSVDPELVPAVLFSTAPLAPGAAPTVEDVAPALLSLYGLKPPETDGRSFLR